jgi:hypothetical protein
LALYVPPNLLTNEYSQILNYIISEADSALNILPGSKLIVTGDINKLPISDLESTLSLQQLVKAPTRGNSILDKFLIDESLCEDYNDPIIKPNFGNSDHKVVYIKPVQKKNSEIRVKKVYDYRTSNISAFVNTLQSQPWQNFYRSNDSIDAKCDYFYAMVADSLKSIPFTLVKMSPRDKPWITPLLKLLINLRYDAYRQGHFGKYRHYKQKIRMEISRAKTSWTERLKREPHGIWKIMKEISTKHQPNTQSFSQEFASETEAADALNFAFSSVFTEPRTHDSLPLPRPSENDNSWHITVSVEKTLYLLNKLKPGKSAGNDGLTTRLLKAARDVLAGPLTHLFACSISSCSLPEKWKQAVIVPIPKVSNPSVSDFRPISLLSIPSKMLETTILSSVKKALISTFGNNQYGFRPGSSTLDAHLAIHDEVTRQLDCAKTSGVAMIAMDLSKAFDRLSHNSLLHTLTGSGLPHNFIRWIENFLSGRTQRTSFQGSISQSTIKVSSGVPQGSILAPYLFACHMGTLNLSSPGVTLIKYADDITTLIPFSHDDDPAPKVQSVLQEITEWCNCHGLTINEQKTKTLLFSKSTPSTSILQVLPNITPHLKILGITFETSLKWNQHVKDVTMRAARRIYTLKQLKRITTVNKVDLLQVYHNFILSIMEYNSPLLVGVNKKNDAKMERIRKRCHRIICGDDCTCDCFTSIQTRRKNRAKKVFERLQHPSNISHRLLPRKLPRTQHFYIEPLRTSRRANSFVPFCALMWNSCH